MGRWLGARGGARVLALWTLGVLTAAACTNGDADRPPPGLAPGARGPDGGGPGEDAGPIVIPSCITSTGKEPAALRAALTDARGTAKVVATGTGCERSFELSTTAELRDGEPKNPRVIKELPAGPTVHTHNPLFDALYQLALTEVRENSVAQIHDGAFDQGAPLTCAPGGCFETGRKWTYVWTRDTAYAVDLGLGWLDPVRAQNSLELKLSTRRDGTDLQIVQDTGTGGSYPVSTDRVVWAVGARELLRHLTGDRQKAFAARALSAIDHTSAHDREIAYDPADGLYRGEQSFLDWREQSYPGWAASNSAHIAMSKSLSTNVGHLALLQTGAELATEAQSPSAPRLTAQATALRAAIRDRLYLPEDKALSTYVTTGLDPAPARRFDLLGTSLAILWDVLTPEQARAVLSSYPVLPMGPPVLFPQQKDTPIYHNRAIWPFVTAYFGRAGAKVSHGPSVELAVRSLMSGAAMNLSNMENLEVVTGKPYLEDGAASGPVVNSQRQLWSVAGYVSMVHELVFGVSTTSDGLRVAPALTWGLRNDLFGQADTLALNGLAFGDRKVSVVVHLPKARAKDPASDAAVLRVESVKLNGRPLEGPRVPRSALADRNLIDVTLGEPEAKPAPQKLLTDTSNYRTLFAPRPPKVTGVAPEGGGTRLNLDLSGEASAEVVVRVYRDGKQVADALPGSATSWLDASSGGASGPSHCYVVESRYVSSGNTSQRSQPNCYWGPGSDRVVSLGAASFTAVGGTGKTEFGRFFYEGWGDPGHTLTATFTAPKSGPVLLQAVYGNGAGPVSTGITCGVKRVEVVESASGARVGGGVLVMPQRGTWDSWGESSRAAATLRAGTSYRVVVKGDARTVNMSAFAHFSRYTGGTGGRAGAFGRVNIAELKVLFRAP